MVDTSRSLYNSYNSNSLTTPRVDASYNYGSPANNHSLHGSYLDNSVSCDPFKEKRSLFNVIYAQDSYDPWGE